MKLVVATFGALIALATPLTALAAPPSAELNALPQADISKLLGSWQVQGMGAAQMVYEFQPHKMAMHGANPQNGATFEIAMDADYRSAGKDAIWVIGTNPRPALSPDGKPSVTGIQLIDSDRATMTVSENESFKLVRVR
jgi:hypothetical protein